MTKQQEDRSMVQQLGVKCLVEHLERLVHPGDIVDRDQAISTHTKGLPRLKNASTDGCFRHSRNGRVRVSRAAVLL